MTGSQTTSWRPFLFVGGIALGMAIAYQDVEGWTGRVHWCAAAALLNLAAHAVASLIRRAARA